MFVSQSFSFFLDAQLRLHFPASLAVRQLRDQAHQWKRSGSNVYPLVNKKHLSWTLPVSSSLNDIVMTGDYLGSLKLKAEAQLMPKAAWFS